MRKRLRTIGVALGLAGLVFVVAGGFAYAKVQDGYSSLQAFSEAQNVTLSYNEDGQLIDRGTVEEAQAIMALLTDDWAYPIVESDFDPNDPLVNTASEYMYQMAVIAYHVMHGTQTVVLAEDVTYDGQVFVAGEYDVPVDGRYWTGFDRMHPLDGQVRSQAWSGTVHGLVGELGVGTVTHSTLQLGLGMAAFVAGIGLVLMAAGTGLYWVGREESFIPDEVPQDWTEPMPIG